MKNKNISFKMGKQPMKVFINDFKMKYRDYEEYSCKAPCSLYSVLLENSQIDNPLFGLNEQKYYELPRYDTEFSSIITVDDKQLENEYLNLVLEGIDTLSDIYLNGIKLGTTDNMHLKYVFPVKEIVHEGENSLVIHIFSPVEYMDKRYAESPIYSSRFVYPGTSHLRKAMYMGGWDWGPRVLDMGIWRPVYIEAYSGAKFDFVQIKQEHGEDGVKLIINPEITGNAAGMTFRAEADGIVKEGTVKGLELLIENPRLWWPNGLGEQYLYEVKLELLNNGEIIDTHTEKIGLRTLTVSRDKDKWGREFCFMINGKKIFAKGANYIPERNIMAHKTNDMIDTLLVSSKNANFNCLRIWGGGYYPDDCFYDRCDELGLIVWQDFMFACCFVELTPEFTENVKKEAVYNIKRFRNHASLGIFCGNNEIEEAMGFWGLDPSEERINDCERLFNEILRDLCAEHSPDTFYWPSSPSTDGNFRHALDENDGDRHVWDQWGQGKDLNYLECNYARFCSEFGIQSYASEKAMREGVSEEQFGLFTDEMDNHQKSTCMSTAKMLRYIGERFGLPADMEDIIYGSQVCQAEGIRYTVEHYRRNMGRCMGALYWQLNDVWPVASWSSVDFLGNPKALQYYAKRFFAPVLLSVKHRDGKLCAYVSNDTLDSFCGKLIVKLMDTDCNVKKTESISVNADSLSVCVLSPIELDIADKRNTALICTLLSDKSEEVSRQTLVFDETRRLSLRKPDIKYSLSNNGKEYELKLNSDTFVRNLMVEIENEVIEFSDNFFDMICGEEKCIAFSSKLGEKEILSKIKLKSEADIIASGNVNRGE